MANLLYATGFSRGQVPIALLMAMYPPAANINNIIPVLAADGVTVFKAYSNGQTYLKCSDNTLYTIVPAVFSLLPPLDPLQFVSQALGGEMPVFSTSNLLTVSGANILAGTGGSFSNRGSTAKYLPAGVDGWFEAVLDSSTAYNVMIAMDADPTNTAFGTADVYLYAGNDPKFYFNYNSGSPGNNGTIPPGLGADYIFRVERRGNQWWLRVRRPSLSAFACNTFATAAAPVTPMFVQTFLGASTILNTPRVASRPAVASSTNVIWDGNSLTVNTVQSGATDSLEAMASMTMDRPDMSGATMTNFGVSGQTTAQMLSDQSTQVLPSFIAGKRNILHVFEIYNDIYYNGVVADAVARYWQYLDQARAYATANGIDLKIIAWGLLDNDITTFGATPAKTSAFGDTASQLQAKLASAHATIKAGWSAHADAFVDPRSSSKLFPYTAQYSWDGTHLYTIGYVELETLAWAQQQQFVRA